MYPFKLIGVLVGFALAPLASPCLADPPKPLPSPKTFVYAPTPQPVKGMLQYGQAPDGRLIPLKPPVLPVHSQYNTFLSVTDPKGHFLYVGSDPLRQFRVSRNGQLVPLKPAAVRLPPANAMAFTPDGRFFYLTRIHYGYNGPTNAPDDLIACRVATDGTLHPIPGGAIKTGTQVSSLAVDNSGRFLYVCVYNTDLSGNQAYTQPYRINKNGTLTLLQQREYSAVAAPTILAAAPSGPFIYMASQSGISTWRIKPDGTLHLLKDEAVFLSVPAFVVDARDNLLIGIGEPTSEARFHANQLAVWHRQPDGTLTEPASAFIADDGFLYGDDKDILDPRNHDAFPVGIVFDADHRLLYVRDLATDRIFRYQVKPDGSLVLRAPWLSTGVVTLDLVPGFSLFLGHGN